ncbi:glycosyltransferase family 2 protein [Leifsonia sp. EB34]|uniref:glycosyltransferase family 2 protein n=1 Tax=Leifsonia sp. EB34 TaxID=3156303 RepID=UPI003513F79F
MTIVHHIVLAVLTFRRPTDIRAILPVLAREAASVAGTGVEVRVQVVDNDPDGSAADAVGEVARQLDVRVDYVVEPTPGISAARNRALAAAADDDLLIFIDDDERPEPGWLAALLATWRATGAEAVVGPVTSTFEVAPDAWMEAGGFFVRRRLATGTEVAVAATNNLLLRLDFVREHGLRFDLDFGITGGDDTMFTRELVRAGGRIVWCAEAMVVDVVPAARVTHRWVMLRAFSSGNSWSTTSAKLAGTPAERMRAFWVSSVSGAARVVLGCLRVAAGIVLRSLRHRARGARTIARGLGMLSGAFGYGYQEYRRG